MGNQLKDHKFHIVSLPPIRKSEHQEKQNNVKHSITNEFLLRQNRHKVQRSSLDSKSNKFIV